jgi:cytochrome oxidase Cu insertion factor (SCO1/SenC/PrrC family)
MKRTFIILLLVLAGCAKKDLPVMSNVPDFKLTERSAREVRRDELAGKVWVADFIFTQCAGTCPLMTANMKKLQDALPAEIQFVSFSVDPAHDTPEVLKAYADSNGADPKRWLFLTGDKDTMYKISIDGFKLALDATGGTPAEPIVHSTRFVLVDRQGRIRGYYGMEDGDALERLKSDAKGLLEG